MSVGSAGIGLGGEARVSRQEARAGFLFGLKVKVIARNPCPTHRIPDDCPESIVGVYEHELDPSCAAIEALFQQNVLGGVGGGSISVIDVSNTSRTIAPNSAASALYVVAGLSSTTPAFTDYALGDGLANTDYKSDGNYAKSATLAAAVGASFSATGTITNGSASIITYKEIGLAITVGGHQFFLGHDLTNGVTGFPVSPAGNMVVIYTGTFS